MKIVNNNSTYNNIVISIQEEERQRIARDLHDTTLQDLTHIVHQLELFGLYINSDPLRANMELISIKSGIKSVIEDIRNVIFDLRPMIFDDLGFKNTLESFLIDLKSKTDIKFIIDIDNIVANDQFLLLNIYRIAVECLHNSVKHSEASTINFSCKIIDNNCHMIIKDDGKGFVMDENIFQKNHFGLYVLQERINVLNGTIDFQTGEGNGTKIYIQVPLNKGE